ncbi:MAG: T9SS type A sorting domain-containing protein [Bacteroidales bacterium]|nr:T9SS type A sorting domain-containing protein [Bacteroidales bacterium]
MKKIFLALLLYNLLSLKCNAQEGFEIFFDTELESAMDDAIEDMEHNYIFPCYQHKPAGQVKYSNALVLKVSTDGDTISKVIDMGDTTCVFQHCVVTKTNHYIVIGSLGYPESNHKKRNFIWIVKMDEQLNIEWDKRYKLADNYWNPIFEASLTGDSMIYIAGYAAIDTIFYFQHLFMMKFNLNGDTLKTSYPFYNSSNKTIYGVLNRPNNNGITVFGHGFDLIGSSIQAVEIDSALDYEVYPVIDPLGSEQANITSKWFTDSTYLVSSLSLNYNSGSSSHYDIQVGMVSDEHVFIDRQWLGRVDTNDYPAWRTSLDFTDKNNIWVMGNIEHFPSQHMDTEILVYLLDSTLNVKGMKLYGGDMNYSAFTTTATSDGGCVLGCEVYDWQNSFEDDQDLWIKKVFPGDIITYAENTPDPRDRDVLVFPNPFSSFIQIKTFRENLVFTLIGLNGRKAIERAVQRGGNNTMNTSGIPKGFYIYKISENNKVIQTGKLVKNY